MGAWKVEMYLRRHHRADDGSLAIVSDSPRFDVHQSASRTRNPALILEVSKKIVQQWPVDQVPHSDAEPVDRTRPVTRPGFLGRASACKFALSFGRGGESFGWDGSAFRADVASERGGVCLWDLEMCRLAGGIWTYFLLA